MKQDGNILLNVHNLVKHFPVTAGVLGKTVAEVQAVSGVSFTVAPGETLGLVGESGCGKTTVGRVILRLLDPTSGRIEFEGRDITRVSMRELRPLRRDMQIIFQDPYSSLNPRMTVRDAIVEPLQIHHVARGREIGVRVAELMERVGLPAAWANRYPHEFSGGQRQRIGIARAIALNPKFIVCDEAVSALDVSVRAQVLNLLIRLREEMNLSYLFIAHDLSVVKHLSHRVAVMYLGHVMEIAPTDELFKRAAHPYTLALLSAIPVPDPTRRSVRTVLKGDVPTPLHPPQGCRFHTRCPAVFDRCRVEEPASIDLGNGHFSKCFLSYDLKPGEDWHSQVMHNYEVCVAKNLAADRPSAPAGEPQPEIKPIGHPHAQEQASPPLQPLRTERHLEKERSLRRPIGFALVLVGVAISIGFSVGYGIAFMLAAFWLILFPGARGKDALILFLIAMLGVSALGGITAQRWRNGRKAARQMELLRREIANYQGDTKQWPTDLYELNWRLVPIFNSSEAMDPWGHSWKYTHNAGIGYELRSAGPDGKLNTADDLVSRLGL